MNTKYGMNLARTVIITCHTRFTINFVNQYILRKKIKLVISGANIINKTFCIVRFYQHLVLCLHWNYHDLVSSLQTTLGSFQIVSMYKSVVRICLNFVSVFQIG